MIYDKQPDIIIPTQPDIVYNLEFINNTRREKLLKQFHTRICKNRVLGVIIPLSYDYEVL